MGLIGNHSVLQKSLARFSNGTATAGAYAAQCRNNFTSPSLFSSRKISMPLTAAYPDGYDIGNAIYLPVKSGGIASQTRISGAGALTAAAISARLSEAALSGSGAVSQADLAVITQGEAALSGSGAVTATALAVSGATTTLTGSGAVTASLSAVIPAEAALSGSGTVASSTNLTGVGRLEAEILPYTELSPQALAESILDQNDVESGALTVREALRLVAASVAGKVSGAETTTITFRNAVADDKNRIVATVDSNGNRTSITYDLDE